MLEVRGVTKRYGGFPALSDVSATFRPGEIHAVLGENGAGKSTLMSVMSGFVMPSEGTVKLDGAEIPLGRAFDCKRLGIEMIHQHFTLVPDFTVSENLALARLDRLTDLAHVDRRSQKSLQAAQRLGWSIDPTARVRTLAVGERQRLEILKALGGEARVLILDEPTAVLSPAEVDDLFRVLRQLRDEGRIVVLIAHKLSEVMAISDRVTVLRRGSLIASALRADVNEAQLADWMVGEMPPTADRSSEAKRTAGLTVEKLIVRGDRGEVSVREVSLEVARGEILGIGGVDGNGQVELAEALARVRTAESGEIRWGEEGQPGIGYVPQDRQIDGLALGMSVQENLLIGGYRRRELGWGPFLRTAKIGAWAQGLVKRFDIRTTHLGERISSLSGGNQQKVVVSRTLDNRPDLLIVVNPTRGLDIRAADFVQTRIREARDAGAAVVLFSTDLDELAVMADRRCFMSRGALIEDQGAVSLVGDSPS